MRTLLFASAALLGLAALPLAAHAGGVTPSPTAPGVVVAQTTVTPPFTVTAPPPPAFEINNPAHISTWRFHAGPNPYQPAQGAWGLSGGAARNTM